MRLPVNLRGATLIGVRMLHSNCNNSTSTNKKNRVKYGRLIVHKSYECMRPEAINVRGLKLLVY